MTAILVEPIRYFFNSYVPEDLTWNEDPKISNIEIDSINNFNKRPLQVKPRILVSRGQYSVNSMGISDSLASAKSMWETKGLKDQASLNALSGVSQVLIEARQEGTCERITDLLSHFLAWSAPMICDTHNFTRFALPMAVSSCTPSKDDIEIFQVSLNLPWYRDERWLITTDGVSLKEFLLTIKSGEISSEAIII
jgi:hypothetical protein